MKNKLLRFVTILTALFLISCSGGDDSPSTSENGNELLGKWVIYKALYDGDTEPIIYEINGDCGREVLEFFENKTVSEFLYVDLDCNNGVGSEWEWWSIGNSKFRMGYSDSDTFKELTFSGNELIFDGSEEWGVIKYYKKVN